MRVLPRARTAKIEWFEARLPAWLADPAAIGLTLAQVQSLQTRTAAARAAHDAAEQARAASQAATTDFHNETDAMERDGRALIATIKAFADTADDPAVFARAQVPPPEAPSPLGPPGRPHSVHASLTGLGGLHLTWRAEDAAPSTGAYFILQRRLDDEPAFTLLGAAANKHFTDNTIPAGARRATYLVTGFRGDRAGEPGVQTTVQFGADRAADRAGARLVA